MIKLTYLQNGETFVIDADYFVLSCGAIETPRIIQQSINELKGTLSLLVISHRLSTVKLADRIVVMDNGAIIQEGTWDALSQDEGLFRRFKGLQIIE